MARIRKIQKDKEELEKTKENDIWRDYAMHNMWKLEDDSESSEESIDYTDNKNLKKSVEKPRTTKSLYRFKENQNDVIPLNLKIEKQIEEQFSKEREIEEDMRPSCQKF